MSTKKHPLLSPRELQKEIPLHQTPQHQITQWRQQLRDILNGEDTRRKVIITGPCSIHDVAAAEEYATKLGTLAAEVSDVLFLIMRVYYEKPRTTLGWKGFCFDPHLDGSHDVVHGIVATRRLLVKVAEMGLPTAAEFLMPLSAPYFQELITWGCIGSRTAESQTHRELASSLPMPVAFKNNTDGNVDVAIRGIIASAAAHSTLTIDEGGSVCICISEGNSASHLVLRGGDGVPNYSSDAIAAALHTLEAAQLPSRLLIDCSHDNSNRNHEQQPAVFHAVLDQVLAGNDAIKGMILESHLAAGKQRLAGSSLDYGVSITDSCLDWESSRTLILQAAEALRNRALHNHTLPHSCDIHATP